MNSSNENNTINDNNNTNIVEDNGIPSLPKINKRTIANRLCLFNFNRIMPGIGIFTIIWIFLKDMINDNFTYFKVIAISILYIVISIVWYFKIHDYK